MEATMSNGMLAHTESFSIATQIYVRLRRVTGRVVDAMYLAENQDYAQYVIDLALGTQDAELTQYAERLRVAMGLYQEPVVVKTAPERVSKIAETEVAARFSVF